MQINKTSETIEALEKFGFLTASNIVKEAQEKKRKLAIAYEHYRFVSQQKINAFNEKLKASTWKNNGWQSQYQTLAFSSAAAYKKVPPTEVLNSMGEAIERKCFDSFEVSFIEEVKEDPILFGRVNGCPDRFFIAQWDNDIKIEQLLADNEG